MMWQAKLKAWAVGLGLTAATIGGTGYLATTGVGQGPGPGAGLPGVGAAKVEKPAVKAAELPPAAVDNGDPVEALQFDIDRAKLQIERADVAIKLDKVMQSAGPAASISDRLPSSISALQAKEDKLVAERNLKLAERRMANVKGQPAPAATAMTAELRKLREQRVELARNNWKAFCGFDLLRKDPDYVMVRILLATAVTASHAVVEAELDVAATQVQRADAWKAQVERLKAIRQALGGKLFLGDGSGLLDSELVAEIRLLELGAK